MHRKVHVVLMDNQFSFCEGCFCPWAQDSCWTKIFSTISLLWSGVFLFLIIEAVLGSHVFVCMVGHFLVFGVFSDLMKRKNVLGKSAGVGRCRRTPKSVGWCLTAVHLHHFMAVSLFWLGVFQILSVLLQLFDALRCWYGWAFSDSSVQCNRHKKQKCFGQILQICEMYLQILVWLLAYMQGNRQQSQDGDHRICVESTVVQTWSCLVSVYRDGSQWNGTCCETRKSITQTPSASVHAHVLSPVRLPEWTERTTRAPFHVCPQSIVGDY